MARRMSAFIAAVLISFSCPLSANFGNIEEVVESSAHRENPAYHHPLMQSIYRHLDYFSKNGRNVSVKQKTALLRAVNAAFFVAHKDATDVAKQSIALAASAAGKSPSEAYRAVSQSAARSDLADAVFRMGAMTGEVCRNHCKPPKKEGVHRLEGRSEGSRIRTKELASRLVLSATWEYFQNNASLDQTAEIGYRVAEWVFLNELASQFVWVLPELYEDEMLWVKDAPNSLHPLASADGFKRLLVRHCPKNNAGYMVFMGPLIACLDWWSEFASQFQFAQGVFQEDSIVSRLPMEMVTEIISKL